MLLSTEKGANKTERIKIFVPKEKNLYPERLSTQDNLILRKEAAMVLRRLAAHGVLKDDLPGKFPVTVFSSIPEREMILVKIGETFYQVVDPFKAQEN